MVVGVDCGLCAFEVAAPLAQCFDERVELLFPGGVAGDGMRMFAGEEADGVRIVGRGWTLKKDSSHSEVRGIRVDLKRKSKVGKG